MFSWFFFVILILFSMCVILTEKEILWEHLCRRYLVDAEPAISPSHLFYWVLMFNGKSQSCEEKNVFFLFLVLVFNNFIVLSYVAKIVFFYFYSFCDMHISSILWTGPHFSIQALNGTAIYMHTLKIFFTTFIQFKQFCIWEKMILIT